MQPTHPPAFLVELFPLTKSDTLEADLHADLGVAVERVYLHLKQAAVKAEVEPSYTDDGELEGMAFFDQNAELLACLTVYRLDRDCDQVKTPEIQAALRLAEPERTKVLNLIFAS